MANIPDDVRELQNYLRTIARYKKTIPLISVDGIFGDNTTDAVKELQRQNALPITGIVDEETWRRIINEYSDITRRNTKAISIDAFPAVDFIITPGASGEIVYFLQLMLISLGNNFHNIPPLALTGLYELDTVNAVKKFQEKSGQKETGETDKLTWDLITNAYNIHSKLIYPAEFR